MTVLWGREDASWIPPAQSVRLAGLTSDRAVVEIPGAGHLVQEDRPEVIVAAVLKAITGR